MQIVVIAVFFSEISKGELPASLCESVFAEYFYFSDRGEETVGVALPDYAACGVGYGFDTASCAVCDYRCAASDGFEVDGR